MNTKKIRTKKLKYIAWNIFTNQDGELESYGYQIVSEDDSVPYNCKLSLIHFQGLVQKYGVLHVLRTPYFRPKDPRELVKFINTLEEIRLI